MIIVMKPQAKKEEVARIVNIIETNGLTAHLSEGSEVTIIGVVGDKSRLDGANLEIISGVDKIIPVTESYNWPIKNFIPPPLWYQWVSQR